jgi:hypothetical protein
MHIPLSSHKVNILILYSDATSGRNATWAFNRILNKIDLDVSDRGRWLEYRLWRLDLLKQPEIQTLASRDVAAADMVVVTVGKNETGWDVFEHWAQSWPSPRRAARRALVAFHDGEISSPAAAHSVEFLRQLADHKGMDLVTNHLDVACAARSLPLERKEMPLEAPRLAGTGKALAEPTFAIVKHYKHCLVRYGINK